MIALGLRCAARFASQKARPGHKSLIGLFSKLAPQFDVFPFDASFLTSVATRTVNEVKGINRVVYDYTSKPPETIIRFTRLRKAPQNMEQRASPGALPRCAQRTR